MRTHASPGDDAAAHPAQPSKRPCKHSKTGIACYRIEVDRGRRFDVRFVETNAPTTPFG